ncbi:hypothetical protein Rhal01_01394 [Rubritalea halochordaticola]|uniref:Major facilitator superfamily (MFS) profile domain-containing protein n=1 Tax=Rubritalea halochordaticola TaxID=714537 RepID=A0ABP9UZV1_9BACT
MTEIVERKVWQKTFGLDLLRAIPMGIVETVGSTFAMFVAVGILEVGTLSKSAIIGGPALGLLISLFSVAMVRRMGMSVNVASALGWGVSAASFAAAALFPHQAGIYVFGIVLAALTHTLASPLQSQIYRQLYPDKIRGKLFSSVGFVRAGAAALFGFYGGRWLVSQGADYSGLFWVFACCSLLKAVFTLCMDRVYLRKTGKLSLLSAFEHLRDDAPFRKLILTWMLLGLGNLVCMALFVEYITNPLYGFGFGAEKVSMVTTTVPMLAFILSVIVWGVIYDRVEFYRLRVIVNLFFIAGVLVYYLSPGYLGLCIGMALHGMGKAGGNVLWSLWVTKFAPADRVGEYMSVHTCFTGIRGVISAFAAFQIALILGPTALGIIGGSLMLLSSCLLIPEVKANWGK